MKRILEYHPTVVLEVCGQRYKLSALVPEYMSDEEFISIVTTYHPQFATSPVSQSAPTAAVELPVWLRGLTVELIDDAQPPLRV